MTRAATFTEADVRRALKVARAENPDAVVEIVTRGATIRILPGDMAESVARRGNSCDEAFGRHRDLAAPQQGRDVA